MGDIKLLIDFGSTFTKIIAVDLINEEIVSRAQVPSTVGEDITIGLKEALQKVRADIKIGVSEEKEALACSSAAGGLRMVAIGFVPDLTCEAATRAALGAGAKIVGRYSYQLNRQEITEIEEILPDIILLAGGTDGGNKKVIIHNAKMLANSKSITAHIVVAGNKAAQDEVKAILEASDKPTKLTENVMPEIGTIDVDSCREVIREVFINNVTKAKGIAKARQIVKDIIMPTPVAVLTAAQLLSQGYMEEPGLGEVIVVDIGGATSDVHSIAKGNSHRGNVILTGLPEPYAKRTVEGDIGVRHNIHTLVELGQREGMLPIDNPERIVKKFSNVMRLPESEEEFAYDTALAGVSAEIATDRHAGKIEVVYGPMGELMVQRGKDLTDVGAVIGTGGPIVFSKDPQKILNHTLFNDRKAHILKPKHPNFYLDNHYILYAMGLLSKVDPKKALSLMKKYIIKFYPTS